MAMTTSGSSATSSEPRSQNTSLYSVKSRALAKCGVSARGSCVRAERICSATMNCPSQDCHRRKWLNSWASRARNSAAVSFADTGPCRMTWASPGTPCPPAAADADTHTEGDAYMHVAHGFVIAVIVAVVIVIGLLLYTLRR